MARLAFAIAAGLALGGCCHDIGGHVPSPQVRAEFGPATKPNHVKRARSRPARNTAMSARDISRSEDALSKLDPNSEEWQSTLDAINRAADDELRKKLIICRGCEPPTVDDQVGAIWPTRAAEGYLSIQKTLRSLSFPEATSSSGLR